MIDNLLAILSVVLAGLRASVEVFLHDPVAPLRLLLCVSSCLPVRSPTISGDSVPFFPPKEFLQAMKFLFEGADRYGCGLHGLGVRLGYFSYGSKWPFEPSFEGWSVTPSVPYDRPDLPPFCRVFPTGLVDAMPRFAPAAPQHMRINVGASASTLSWPAMRFQ